LRQNFCAASPYLTMTSFAGSLNVYPPLYRNQTG
jgi:hypothetical protein